MKLVCITKNQLADVKRTNVSQQGWLPIYKYTLKNNTSYFVKLLADGATEKQRNRMLREFALTRMLKNIADLRTPSSRNK